MLQNPGNMPWCTLYNRTFNNSESYQAAPLTLGAVATFVFLAFFLFLVVILSPSSLGFINQERVKFHPRFFFHLDYKLKDVSIISGSLN